MTKPYIYVKILKKEREKVEESVEKAKAHLEKFGLCDRIIEFDVSSATVALAAQALGVKEAKIAKSLGFLTPDGAIIVVMAGDAKADNAKFKATFNTKAKMIPFEEVEAVVGYAAGGVCPFGINDGIKVYLDESLRRFDVVYPAAGTASSAVRLTVNELLISSGAVGFVDISKLPI